MLGNLGGGLNKLFNGSVGMQANRMLDALGLPDSLGDAIGAQIDAASGDFAGFARNMMDLTSGLKTNQLDGLFGKGLIGPHFNPAPKFGMMRGKKLWSNTFHTPFGNHEISRERLGPKGPFGRLIGRSMERAILKNPAFKAQMEAKLGGRIIMDGRADGRITVDRYTPKFNAMPLAKNFAANPMLSGIYGSLARMEANIKGLASSMTQSGNAAGSFGVNGSSSTAKGDGILKDPQTAELAKGMGMQAPLSFEDLLFLMMMKYAKKKEGEIMNKMNELGNKDATGGASKTAGLTGAKKAQYNSALAKINAGSGSDTLKKMQTQKLQADMGLGVDKDNGKVFDAAKSDTLKQMQMQKLMEDLKKMYEMLSNVMKSMHDMQMSAVRNLR